jgi:16S rRNA (cytosine1407-C5)-methyltransferase
MKSGNLHHSLERFSSILSQADLQKILEVQQQPLPVGIRLNPLKVNPEAAIKDWTARYGWQVQAVPFCELAWTIHNAQVSPGKTIEHRMGQYYIQDAASMVPVSLFEMNKSYPLVLDMAASPGGKTTHLADRTLDHGFIIANDASQGRIPALRSVLSTWGATSFAITQFIGESFGRWFPETFDFILLDAPCSMENLRPTDNHPLRETTTDERMRLHARQVQLLTSGLSALKVGGQMVYATCSLAPEEDEAVIDAVMKAFPNCFTIEDVTKKFLFKTPGLTAFEGQTFSPDLSKTLRLWPHLTAMSGFFCGLLTKTKPMPLTSESPPARDFHKTGLETADPSSKIQIQTHVLENFGVDLFEISEGYHLEWFARNSQFHFIPQIYLNQFSSLPFAYIGMPLGSWNEPQFELSHSFVSRFGHTFTRGKIIIEDELVNQWTAGRDIRYPKTDLPHKGQYLLVNDRSGRNLGLGKLLPKRLRNLLPRPMI